MNYTSSERDCLCTAVTSVIFQNFYIFHQQFSAMSAQTMKIRECDERVR